MSEITIYPTGECFDDALANIVYIMKKEGTEIVRRGHVLIVHGIIAPDGKDISHAWLERDGKLVIFSGIIDGEKVLVESDIGEYYEKSVVKESTKYTLFEAFAAEVRTGHFGPWEKRYRDLLND